MKELTVIMLITLFILSACIADQDVEHPDDHPAPGLSHAHGLFIDSNNSSKLIIPTHKGLFILENDKDLYLVGNYESDYMSFVMHPEDSGILFASGHENDHHNEGEHENLGLLRSVDGGINWELYWNGFDQPVDFHSMGISPANPDLMYAMYTGDLHISIDGGKNWKIIENDLYETLTFAPHPTNEDIVYAATAYGVMISEDQGISWEFLSSELERTAVINLIINPVNPDIMFSYSKKLGLARSINAGLNWESLPEDFSGELILNLAIDQKNTNIMYAITKQNSIYKSIDEGKTWKKLIFLYSSMK